MSIKEIGGLFVPVCDNCGETLQDMCLNEYQAELALTEKGWKTTNDYTDYCPKCKEITNE